MTLVQITCIFANNPALGTAILTTELFAYRTACHVILILHLTYCSVSIVILFYSMQCRGVYPYLPMATNAPWSIFFFGGGESIKSLILNFNIYNSMNFVHKFINIFALYSLFYHFLRIFSLAALARLRFIPHLETKSCNVLYQLCLYIFFSFLVIIADCQLPKFTENTHKIAQTCV